MLSYWYNTPKKQSSWEQSKAMELSSKSFSVYKLPELDSYAADV
jgi:hypothetical protein